MPASADVPSIPFAPSGRRRRRTQCCSCSVATSSASSSHSSQLDQLPRDTSHDEIATSWFVLRTRSALNGGRAGGAGPSMSARASTSAPQSGHVVGSRSRTSTANCVWQPSLCRQRLPALRKLPVRASQCRAGCWIAVETWRRTRSSVSPCRTRSTMEAAPSHGPSTSSHYRQEPVKGLLLVALDSSPCYQDSCELQRDNVKKGEKHSDSCGFFTSNFQRRRELEQLEQRWSRPAVRHGMRDNLPPLFPDDFMRAVVNPGAPGPTRAED